jgi:hypothetical protein
MARPRAAGRVFYLGRFRVSAGDPPELVAFLERLEAAEAGEKHLLLRGALVGGMGQATAVCSAEGAETKAALDAMLAGF